MKQNKKVLAAIRRGTTSSLAKAYPLVCDSSTDSIISWTESGKSFIIWKPEELSGEFLFRFMGLSLYSTFTRTLERYGIKKVEGSEKLEYAGENFVRGKPELFNRIFEGFYVERLVKSGKKSREEAIEWFREEERKGLITIRPNQEPNMKTKIMKKKTKKQTKKAVAKELSDQLQQLLQI